MEQLRTANVIIPELWLNDLARNPAQGLAKVIKQSTQLRKVVLDVRAFLHRAEIKVARAVGKSTCIQHLAVRGGRELPSSWPIADMIQASKSLRTLHMEDQKFFSEDAGDWKAALSSNRSLVSLKIDEVYSMGGQFRGFIAGLSENTTVRTVELALLINALEDDEEAYLKDGHAARDLQGNFSLLHFDLFWDGPGIDAINAITSRNRRLKQLLQFRRAHETRRDAGMVFRAAANGRPMELARRLRLGKLAGGLEIKGVSGTGSDVMTTMAPLEAALAGGHDECAGILTETASELAKAQAMARKCSQREDQSKWTVARPRDLELLKALVGNGPGAEERLEELLRHDFMEVPDSDSD